MRVRRKRKTGPAIFTEQGLLTATVDGALVRFERDVNGDLRIEDWGFDRKAARGIRRFLVRYFSEDRAR